MCYLIFAFLFTPCWRLVDRMNSERGWGVVRHFLNCSTDIFFPFYWFFLLIRHLFWTIQLADRWWRIYLVQIGSTLICLLIGLLKSCTTTWLSGWVAERIHTRIHRRFQRFLLFFPLFYLLVLFKLIQIWWNRDILKYYGICGICLRRGMKDNCLDG